MTTAPSNPRSITMNLIHEDMARAHTRERLRRAHDERRGHRLATAQRLARRAEKAAEAARLHQARAH